MHKGILVGIVFIYLKVGLNGMAMKAIDQKVRGKGVAEKKKQREWRGRGGRSQTQFFFCVWLLPPSPPLSFPFFFFCSAPPPPPDFLAEVYPGAQDTTNRSRNITILWVPFLYTQRYNLKVRLISSKSYVK